MRHTITYPSSFIEDVTDSVRCRLVTLDFAKEATVMSMPKVVIIAEEDELLEDVERSHGSMIASQWLRRELVDEIGAATDLEGLLSVIEKRAAR